MKDPKVGDRVRFKDTAKDYDGTIQKVSDDRCVYVIFDVDTRKEWGASFGGALVGPHRYHHPRNLVRLRKKVRRTFWVTKYASTGRLECHANVNDAILALTGNEGEIIRVEEVRKRNK